MAIYYSTTARAFFDTDIFPTASLPQDSVVVNTNDYTNLMVFQNTGNCIFDDGHGNPTVGFIVEDSATEILHAEKKASANGLGHVMVEGTSSLMSTTAITIKADGTIGIAHYGIDSDLLANNAVTSQKISTGAVTNNKIGASAVKTANIEDGAVTEQKLDSVKDLDADETSLTLTEGANAFTMSIKAGGVGATEIAANAVETAKINDGAVTTQKIGDGAVATAKIENHAVTKDKLASAIVPSVLSFNIHHGTLHWYSSDDYFIIADFPADAGMIFDFTFRYDTEVANASTGDDWCVDLVVKTGLTYNGAVENARQRIFFNSGDRQSMRFAFNGLGSGNIYLAAERQTLHPSWDPTEFSINEVYLSGIKIFGN